MEETPRQKKYQRNKEKSNAQSRAWRAANPDRHRELMWRQLGFELSVPQYNAMVSAQEGRCAICRRSFQGTKNTHVDHNHSTGRVRALLCGNCNRGIGMFDDQPDILLAAIDYLQYHNGGK